MTSELRSIRLATVDDAEACAAIYAPAVTDRATSFELVAPDAAEMAARIEKVLRRTPWLVAEELGTVIGYAYAGAHKERAAYQWSVDVSAYVAQSAQRRGVARAMYGTLLALLRLQRFQNAYAGVALPNPASEGLHRAMGFEPVGVYQRIGYKLGAWHDVAWFSLALGAHELDPTPPIPLPQAMRDPAFARLLGR